MTTTSRAIQFLLRLDNDHETSTLDLAALRERLNTTTDNCRIVLEGMVGGPSPKVLAVWTPRHALSPGELPGYTMSYKAAVHPLRSTALSIPRIHPFARLTDWRDAVLRTAEDWVANAS